MITTKYCEPIQGQEVSAHKQINIVVIGDFGAGKTAFIDRFIKNIFSDQAYVPPVGGSSDQDTYRKIVALPGKSVQLNITEEYGQYRHSQNPGKNFCGANAVVLVCDVTVASSMRKEWIEEARKNVENASCYLVATKCDLTTRRVIESNQVEEFAKAHTLTGIFEVSSKTGANVEKAFSQIAEFELNRSGQQEDTSVCSMM